MFIGLPKKKFIVLQPTKIVCIGLTKFQLNKQNFGWKITIFVWEKNFLLVEE